jgi:hypothetical protein
MAFMFRLEDEAGNPADPPMLQSAVPNWRPGDSIPLGGRTLRVVEVRDDDADQPPVLVVEPLVRGGGGGSSLDVRARPQRHAHTSNWRFPGCVGRRTPVSFEPCC